MVLCEAHTHRVCDERIPEHMRARVDGTTLVRLFEEAGGVLCCACDECVIVLRVQVCERAKSADEERDELHLYFGVRHLHSKRRGEP